MLQLKNKSWLSIIYKPVQKGRTKVREHEQGAWDKEGTLCVYHTYNSNLKYAITCE